MSPVQGTDLSLYLVTDTGQCSDRGVVETVRRAVAGGVTCVQVRDKDCSDAELLALLMRVADTVGDQVSVLVDDRPEVAHAARSRGASVHGVHLGQDDASAVVARELLGPDAVVGLTAHTPDQLSRAAALREGTVDYLGVGAVAVTTTKSDHPPVLGVDGFTRVVLSTSYPCVAIGGIDATLVPLLRDAGAAGIAVVSAVCAADEPEKAARLLAEAWAP